MADAEAIRRREIRRRKILEGSEARLKRITSTKKHQISHDASEDYLKNYKDVQKLVGITENLPLSSGIKGSECSKNEFSSMNLTSKNDRQCSKDHHNSDKPKTRLLEAEDSSHSISTNGAVQRPYNDSYYSFPKKVSDAETRSFARTRCEARRNSTCTQMMMETFQFSSFSLNDLRPWITVVLAFIVKAYFLVTEKLPVFETLFFPCLMLELAFYSWMKFESQMGTRSPPSSVIPSILLLCGFSASAVSGFSAILNFLQCAIQDFGVYIFSFIFLHFVSEIYV